MKIKIIPCLKDNYSYLIIDEENNIACVVDPSEAKPIIEYLEKTKMKLKFLVLLPLMVILSACAAKKPAMTPLELQSMQSRDYSNKYNVVFSSTMSVFQDLGYTISAADKDTGLISAESAAADNVWARALTGVSVNNQTKATAFIEKVQDKVNVRLNFVAVNKSSTAYGQSNRNDVPILEMAIYQNAFERIENAIFIRK